MDEGLPQLYIAIITVISGWLKVASICFTIPSLLTGQSIMNLLVIKLTIALVGGALLGVGYGYLLLDIIKLQELVKLPRLLFFDIILTLAFLFGAFVSDTFILTSFVWSLLSIIGLLLSPIPASDSGVSKATRLFGFLILGVSLPLKFVDIGRLLLALSDFFPILGGILSIAGIGEKIKGK